MAVTAKQTIVKKKWIPIHASKHFSEQQIGESFVADDKSLVGRHVKVSLMTIIGDPSRQAVHVDFKITNIANGVAQTELVGFSYLPVAMKKFVRRRKEKFGDSFVSQTQDGFYVRVKPIAVTRGRTTGIVLTNLRKFMRAYVAKHLSQMPFDIFVRSLVEKKFQHGLGTQLSRIYPIGACEIRAFEVIPKEKIKELGIKIVLPPEHLPNLASKKKVEPVQEVQEPVQADEQPAQA
jgi:small subunit ribosomal protein S3Ae